MRAGIEMAGGLGVPAVATHAFCGDHWPVVRGLTIGSALLAASAVAASLVGGPVAAVIVVALPALRHILRSPERTFDMLYAAAFCAMGALLGR